MLEKRQLRESVLHFKTNALAVHKSKEKKIVKMNTFREMANLMYSFVQKTNINATEQV